MAQTIPEHLRFVSVDGVLIHGRGPYTVVVMNEKTNATRPITLPALTVQSCTVENIREIILKALEEQLDEDFKR